MDLNGHNRITEILSSREYIYNVSVHPTDWEFVNEAAEDQSARIYEDARFVDIVTTALPSAVLTALHEGGVLYDEDQQAAHKGVNGPVLKLLGICKDNVYTLTFKDMVSTK